MDSATLAKAVASELLNSSSVLLLLILIPIFAGIGGFLGKYLETKGTNLATKEDFDTLQVQLRESTRLVESVKSEISQTDWGAREWNSLRINKIEELMTLLHKCEEYLDTKRNASIECRHHPETAPYDQANIIAELYLPELEKLVRLYVLSCRKLDLRMTDLVQQGLREQNSGKQYDPTIWENFFENSEYSELTNCAHEVRRYAAQLLQKIVLEHK